MNNNNYERLLKYLEVQVDGDDGWGRCGTAGWTDRWDWSQTSALEFRVHAAVYSFRFDSWGL